MESFVESWTGRTLLIRLGPDALQDGDPWTRQVTVKEETDEDGTRVGTIKGYAGQATEEILDTIVKWVNSEWGLPARYLRRRKGRSPYWMRQISGVNGGNIIMATKTKIPHTDAAKKPDGSIDMAIAERDAKIADAVLKDGSHKLIGLHTTDLADDVRATTFVVKKV